MEIKYVLVGILLLIVAYPVWKILKKTGHHPLLTIFFFIPFINIVMLYILASGKWPIQYERDALLTENEKLRKQKKDSNKALHGD